MNDQDSLIQKVKKGFLAIPAVFISFTVFSEVKDVDNLFHLSLEELTQIKVSIASRAEEHVNFAVGNVTVYSNQEIKAFGERNLRDVLDRLTSMQVITSHVFPHHKLSMRGVNTGINDTSVLVLINGNPIRNANGGGSSAALYNGISFSMIDRIEVIRGPGSILYGSNAFAGVINIVTKTSEEAGTLTSIEATAGTFDSKGLDISSQFSGQNYDVLLGVNLETNDGDNFEDITDEFGNTGTYFSGFEQTTLMATGTVGQFSFTSLYTDFEINNGGGLFKLVEQSYYDEKKYIAVGYGMEISNNWELKLNYLYNDQVLKWQVNNSQNSGQVSDSNEQQVEIYAQGNLTESVGLITGASRSLLQGEFALGTERNEFWRQSYFVQTSVMVNPSLKVVVGFQWNRPQESEGDLSSRLGLVRKFGENWWLKLSYGEAFRAPFGTELFVDSPGLVGNPTLKPEQMKTYEAQFIYGDIKKNFAISLYSSKQSETITRAVIETGSPPSFINQGRVDYQGIEIEGKISMTDRLMFTFNANYQTSETGTGIKDDSFAPNEMNKAGFLYQYSNNLSFALFNSFIGKSTDLNETKGIELNNPVPESYNLLTANLIWDIGQDIQQFEKGSTFITIYLDNILDEEIFAPDVVNRGGNNSIPSHYGFNASISFKHTF